MDKKSNVLIVVPARIGSRRLPRKLLQIIGDITVIEHVINNLSSSNTLTPSDIIIATDDDQIARLSKEAGALPVITSPDCPSGSDRVYEAISKLDLTSIEYVINVQGDMPFVDPLVISKLVDALENSDCDIVTPYVKISKEEAAEPSNVKIVKDNNDMALYFSRSLVPYGAEEFLYHVGIYGYRVDSLKKFINLEHGKYEMSESLEQLRALENGMKIKLVESDQIPISIDTQGDLEKAREYYSKLHGSFVKKNSDAEPK